MARITKTELYKGAVQEAFYLRKLLTIEFKQVLLADFKTDCGVQEFMESMSPYMFAEDEIASKFRELFNISKYWWSNESGSLNEIEPKIVSGITLQHWLAKEPEAEIGRSTEPYNKTADFTPLEMYLIWASPEKRQAVLEYIVNTANLLPAELESVKKELVYDGVFG